MNRILSILDFKSLKTSFLVIFVLAVLICILKLNYYDWPPNRDVTFYAVTSHELLQGESLYSDFWDIKPPAIFISYGAAEALFGYGPLALYVMNIGCALIILFGVYTAGSATGYGRSAGIWAALFWTALSGDISLQLHDANTEIFMNACVIWAFVLFLNPGNRPFSVSRTALIGALFAWASLYKQVIIFIPLLLSIGHIGLPPTGTSRQQAAVQIAIIGTIGAISWSLVFAYMTYTGRFQVFFDTIMTHAMAYAGSPSGNVAGAVSSGNLFEGVHRFMVVIPLVLLASIGIAWGLIKEKSRIWVMITLYAVGAFISIAIPGKFFRHYFQLGIPPLVVAGGWATVIFSRNRIPFRALMPHFAAAFVLLFIVGNQISYYTSDPETELKDSYAELYLITQKLGSRLSSIIKKDETMFQWGAETGLYFFSQRRPPASIHCWSHFYQTFGEAFTHQTMNKLKASPPDLIILAKYFLKAQPDHEIQKWIYSNYEILDATTEEEEKYFVLMALQGSDLGSGLKEMTPSLAHVQ